MVVKWHRIISSAPAPPSRTKPLTARPWSASVLNYGTLTAPDPEAHAPLRGYGLRLGYRKRDFLQVAHYARMLATVGLRAPGSAVGWGHRHR